MMRHTAAYGLFLALSVAPRLAVSTASDAALTRAVAAKEMALDRPEPARWQEAFDRFREADELDASADTKYELGFIAAQLRQEDLALGYFEDAIDLGLDGPALDKAKAFVRRYGNSMARLDVRGKVGIRLRIRGVDRGVLPLSRPLVVYPGVTRLDVIDRNGRYVTEHSFSVEAGQTERVELPLGAATLPQPPVVRPLFQPMQDVKPSTATRPAGIWLLGVGAGLMLTGAITVPLSMAKLELKRGQLAHACDTPSNSPDGCLAAKRGRYDEAVDLAVDIARWRTVRAIGWTGFAVGATSSALGLYLMMQASTAVTRSNRFAVWPTTEPHLLAMNCRVSF